MESNVRQALIYDYLRYCNERQYQPSLTEVAEVCGMRVEVVEVNLDLLRSRGCVDWSGDEPRAIYITGQPAFD